MILGIIAGAKQIASTGDPYWAFVKSLLHFDAADGTNVFTDETGRSWSALATASISTDQWKFGGSSFECAGGSDAISTANVSGDFITSVDFTIECWIYRTGSLLDRNVITSKYATFTSDGFTLQVGNSANLGKLNFSLGSSGTYYTAQGTTDIAIDTWYFVTAVKEGNLVSLYLDGVLEDSVTISGTPATNSSALYIGRDAVSLSRNFEGFIDDFRFTQGIARYSSNFSIPTSAFPNG